MSGKPTPAELAAAATEWQHVVDREVAADEGVLHDVADLSPRRRRIIRAKLVVYHRLSKALARIIAGGAPEPPGDDVESL